MAQNKCGGRQRQKAEMRPSQLPQHPGGRETRYSKGDRAEVGVAGIRSAVLQRMTALQQCLQSGSRSPQRQYTPPPPSKRKRKKLSHGKREANSAPAPQGQPSVRRAETHWLEKKQFLKHLLLQNTIFFHRKVIVKM